MAAEDMAQGLEADRTGALAKLKDTLILLHLLAPTGISANLLR
jgi:hypothetical protein